DEALFLPECHDARHFFASVQDEYDQVVFNNLEAVPESLHVKDWFREVSLFKVHQHLLQESESEKPDIAPHGQRRRDKVARWRQRKLALGADPEDLRDNRTFDTLMIGVRVARRPTACSFQLNLPQPDEDSDKPSESEDERSAGPSSSGPSAGRRSVDLPCFFTAYGNGKAACRLRRGSNGMPLPVGVHRFASDANAPLRSLRCSGPGSPVVLHYANCGYEAWVKKYTILAKGHGTEDGGFSVTRKGIKSMRAHLAHRELLARADPAQLEATKDSRKPTLPVMGCWLLNVQQSLAMLELGRVADLACEAGAADRGRANWPAVKQALHNFLRSLRLRPEERNMKEVEFLLDLASGPIAGDCYIGIIALGFFSYHFMDPAERHDFIRTTVFGGVTFQKAVPLSYWDVYASGWPVFALLAAASETVQSDAW
ncbi:unnamed protein product, partial [Polarella glacialis]